MKLVSGLLQAIGLAPKAPKVISPSMSPPSITDPAIEEAKRKATLSAKRASGYASTLITGGMGDTSKAPAVIKSLMGQ